MQQLKSLFISTLHTALILTILVTLTACGSTRYSGKIIPGTVGRPIIVSTTDDRINNNPGLEGLTVTIYNESRGGQPPAQITRTTSDENGEFVFTIPSAQTPRGAVVIRVTGDDIYAARSKAFLPRAGQLMLFSVVTRNPFPDSATASEESADE